MRLPENLREAIAAEVAVTDSRALARASSEITAAYKQADFDRPVLASEAHRLAYALVRMPATFAANLNALQSLRQTCSSLEPKSILDLGAGPGTSMWAVAEVFPAVERFTLIERDVQFSSMGKRLASSSEHPSLRNSVWVSQDLVQAATLPAHDLVLCSYALGELSDRVAARLIALAWSSARQALVVVESGTRRGFETILRVRSQLISLGANIAAPCPHHEQCPMAAAGDWCHFSQRIERTAEHRRLKEASLGYEDEKFSYVAVTNLTVERPRARIIRHPLKFSGHIKLQLCSGPELEFETVTRSQKPAYKNARRAAWGDGWDH